MDSTNDPDAVSDFVSDFLGQNNLRRQLSAKALAVASLVLTRLAEDQVIRLWLKDRSKPVLLVGADDLAFSWFVSQAVPDGATVIFFSGDLLERPGMEAAAVVAHEFGHLRLRDLGDASRGQEAELAADAFAAGLGFRAALLSSLEKELAAQRDNRKREQIQERIRALRGAGTGPPE